MSDIIDLDALIPKPAVIRFGDADITVQPPKVYTILRIADYWQISRQATSISEKELIAALQNLKDEIYKCIPELAGQEFSYPQITTLVELLTKMSLPPEKAEADSKGISPAEDTPDPKVPQD